MIESFASRNNVMTSVSSTPASIVLPIVQDANGASAAGKAINMNTILYTIQDGYFLAVDDQPEFIYNVAHAGNQSTINVQSSWKTDDSTIDFYLFTGYASFTDQYVDLTRIATLTGLVSYVNESDATNASALLDETQITMFCNGWLVRIPASNTTGLDNLVVNATFSYGTTIQKEDSLESFCARSVSPSAGTTRTSRTSRLVREMRLLRGPMRKICKTCNFQPF